MTQMEHVDRRTTVLVSAAVALVVSLAITISGMLIIPQLTSTPASEGVDRYAEAGRAWQVQRELESSHFRNRLHALAQGEAEWQLRYDQTNPNR
ncbi:MAG TPA: hypothetical protein VLA05_08040 [Coriobacteriia bacterium]|nr:hypothetical protein [Coriobacteriia bacterium]